MQHVKRLVITFVVLLGAIGALRTDKAAALPPCTGCGTPTIVSRDACGRPVPDDPACNPMGSPYYSYDRSWLDATCDNGHKFTNCAFNKKGNCCSMTNEIQCPSPMGCE